MVPSARVKQGNHIHSVMQVLHADTDQAAPRPDASPTRASAGLGFPSRRGPLPARRPPQPREANPTWPAHPEALPSSHLPARDAHSPAPVRPGPAIPGAPSLRAGRHPRPYPPLGSKPPDGRPLGARAPDHRPRRAPRSLTPLPALSPPRSLTREDSHALRLSLTGLPAPRAPAAARFRLAVCGGGEEQQWPSVLTHRRAVPVPSARRSAVRRCAAMRAVPAPPLAVEAT